MNKTIKYLLLLLFIGLVWGQESYFYLPKIDLFGSEISTWHVMGWMNIFLGKMAILFYGVKRNYDEFDQSLYVLPIDEDPKGTILSLSIGLQGGVKYTIPAVGTVYIDITGSYAILAQANNYTASESSFYSPLLFGFNLGFRKDLY